MAVFAEVCILLFRLGFSRAFRNESLSAAHRLHCVNVHPQRLRDKAAGIVLSPQVCDGLLLRFCLFFGLLSEPLSNIVVPLTGHNFPSP